MRIAAGVFVLALVAGCATSPSPSPSPSPGPAKAAAPAPQQAAQAGGPNATKAADDPNKRVCRRVTPTGSNMPQRDCATAAEWARRDAAGRAGAEEVKRQINSMTGTPGN